MKQWISLLLAFLVLFSVTGCFRKLESNETPASPNTETAENSADEAARMLREVLANERTLITGDGQAVYPKDYPVHETLKAEPCEYAFVDLDGDGRTEAAVNLSRQVGVYLVLREYGQKVFGYPFTIRAFLDLKTDGSFVGSGGAGTHYYKRMTFENEQCVVHTEAIDDVMGGVYEINGQPVCAEEADEFAKKHSEKEDVQWYSMDADASVT